MAGNLSALDGGLVDRGHDYYVAEEEEPVRCTSRGWCCFVCLVVYLSVRAPVRVRSCVRAFVRLCQLCVGVCGGVS